MDAMGGVGGTAAAAFRPALVAIEICAISLTATVGVAVWAWRRRAASTAAIAFVGLVVSEAVWNAGHLGELASVSLAAKVAWDCFETLPTVGAAFFMLVFAALYAGRRLPGWLLAAIATALLVPTLIILADPVTHGLRGSAHLEPPYGALVYDFTAWDLTYISEILVLAVAAVGMVVGMIPRQRSPFRAQTAALAAALAFPVVAGVGWLGLDLRLEGERDVSHVYFAIGALLMAWALSRWRLFDLVPIAREAVLDRLTDAVLVVDRLGRVVDANQVAAALFQRGSQGLVGQRADVALEDWSELAAMLTGEDPRQEEVPSPSTYGRRWYDARWSALRDPGGRWLGGTLVLRDVTTLRQARTLLEERVQRGTEDLAVSEGRFRTLFDQTFQLIGLLDRRGNLLAANRAALDMIGQPQEAVLGRPFWETGWWSHDPDQRARLREAIERAAAGEFVRFETTHAAAGGRVRAIDFSLMPVRDVRGDVVQIIPEGRDVTEVQEAQARAAALAVQLQQAQKLEAIGRVAAGVAHDFNNLLTVISGGVTVARQDLVSGSPAADMLDEALQAVDSAAGVTRQLLTFSRKQPTTPRRLSFPETLAQTEGILRRLARPANLLDARLGDGLWPIFMDPAQLQQVLMNLVVNARDAMPDGGPIVISAENAPVQAGDYVRVEVRDSGKGMPEEVRAHIFEPFFTTKPAGEGTGLGLAVVQGAVQGCGGFIELDSSPAGTVVALYLPRAP
ncbi:MAG TPA: PAS domain-containing protein [Polyangia bacterium]|nr:PAS domain-containing protein [Polyangia bacterium]